MVQNKETEHTPKKSPEELTKGIESIINLVIKKSSAKKINQIIELLATLINTLPEGALPEEDIDVEAITRALLKDEYYLYSAVLIRTLKIFGIWIGICLNVLILKAVVYSFRFLNFLKLCEYTEKYSTQQIPPQHILNSSRHSHFSRNMPEDKFVPMHEEAAMLPGQTSQTSPGTQSTPLYTPEQETSAYERELPSTRGIIQIPYIERKVEDPKRSRSKISIDSHSRR